jgi:hypothetical protein
MGDMVKTVPPEKKKYQGLNRAWYPRNYLINPHVQLKIVFLLGGIASVTSIIICAIAYERLLRLGALFNHSVVPPVAMPGVFKGIADSLMFRLLGIVSLMIGAFCIIGIILTHRVAGPIWKLQTQLKKFLSGEDIQPIRFRRRDEFRELPELINKLIDGYRGPRDKS